MGARRVFLDTRSPGLPASADGALLTFPEDPVIAASVCVGEPNSTGDHGTLAIFGDYTTTASKTMRATELPTNALAFLLASRSTGSSMPPGSSGRLCLGGAIGRYAGSVLSSGSAGRFDFAIDPTAIAQPTGSVAAMAGDTWFFQAWHRDADPTRTSNFTNAISVTLQGAIERSSLSARR